jgi:hypothetical protein
MGKLNYGFGFSSSISEKAYYGEIQTYFDEVVDIQMLARNDHPINVWLAMDDIQNI